MKQAIIYRHFTAASVAVFLAGVSLSSATRAAEHTQPPTVQPSSIAVDPGESEAKSLPTKPLPPLPPDVSKAAQWLQLIDQATVGDSWQEPVACRNQAARERTGMCRLQWRKRGGLSSLRGRYDDLSYEMTRRVAGRHLADHLEFDIDRSPEIRLRYEFD